jgi:hypothetical protein
MKKNYFVLIILFVIIASLKANAFNITVNVDDASRVSLYLGSSKQTLTDGDNVLDVKTGDRLYFSANTGYVLKSVMNGTTAETISSLTSCMIGLDEATHTDAKWIVTTCPLDDVRTASCKVTVDDASKVTLGFSGTYTTYALKDGENDVKFVPEVESTFAISAKDNSVSLYSVKKNSEPVSPQYGTYRIDVVNGDKIEIQANYPDEDYSVKFNLSEKAEGFITKVQVNGVEVKNFMDDNFTVKAGSQVSITGNTNDYSLESFKVNGSDVDFYGSYSFMVTGPTNVDIVAHKYGNISAVLDIDDASHVTVYKGYSYYGNSVEVKTGKNTIEVPESTPVIAIKANDGYTLVSVSDGTTDFVERDGNSEVNVKVTDAMNITVKTAELVRDKNAVVYVEDASVPSYMRFMRKDYTTIDLATGYNHIPFYDGNLPFSSSFYGTSTLNVYKNDELMEPQYTGATSYTLNVEDNDVVKFFFTKTPAIAKATVTVEGDAKELTAVKDQIKEVADFTNPISCLEDTELSFSVSDKSSVKSFTMNGTAVTPQEDGTYKVIITADSDIKVELGVASGIKSVTGSENKANNVYTTDGVLVIKNATRSQIDGLAKGIYIINGKKIIR